MKIFFAGLSYLIGSFPTGYILYYLIEKKDIRKFGSCSIGATNMLRLKGWRFALPVAGVDILKGFLPVFLTLRFFSDTRFALLCGFLSVLGHCYPFYLKFKGGKGVATTVGIFSVVALVPLLISLSLFFLVIAVTRYVSLGSLLAVFSLPISAYLTEGNTEITFLGLAVFLLIAVKHAANIKRLVHGNEKKIGEKAS